MNIWTITHVNGLVSPIHEEGPHGQEHHGRAFSIKSESTAATNGFCWFTVSYFELVAGAHPTLYVQIYVLENTERQRIWQARTLRFSDDSPTRRTASTKSLSIVRAGHQVGDDWAYELGTKSTRT
jgi:hypothetical protein